jgi:hypothetical protein
MRMYLNQSIPDSLIDIPPLFENKKIRTEVVCETVSNEVQIQHKFASLGVCVNCKAQQVSSGVATLRCYSCP